jgi:peptidoglycan/LPS O-acetylase OafA/YrhL
MSSSQTTFTYRPEIDGLRAVAVISVVLFHAGFTTFSGGFAGVDVFFVISGYLISQILIRELGQGRFSIVRFYERRARRILPALFVVLLCCVPFAWLWMLPMELRRFGQSLMAVATFSSNILFWFKTDYFSPSAEEQPLLHTWSLAVEEQYYIVFPVLLALGWKLGRRRVAVGVWLIALTSFLGSEWASRHHEAANFYLLPSRAWELLAGVLAALWQQAQQSRSPSVAPGPGSLVGPLVGLALIAYSVVGFGPHTPTPSAFALAPVLGAVLIVLFATHTSSVGRLLSWRPLVGIGLLSYSAYLWHQPILAFARLAGVGSSTPVRLLLAFSAFPLAYLSWRFVEQPLRRPGALPGMGWAWASAAGLVACCALGGVFHVAQGFAGRQIFVANPQVREYLAVKEQIDGWEHWCEEHPAPDRKDGTFAYPLCAVGAPGVTPDMIVWGDSFAGALIPGLNHELRRAGRASLVFTQDGCPPLPGVTIPGKQGCTEDVHSRFIQYLARLPTVKYVIWFGHLQAAMTLPEVRLNGEPTSPAAATEAARKTLAELRALGKQVIFVQQGPYMPLDVPDFYMRSALRKDGADLAVTRAEYHEFIAPVLGLRPLIEPSGRWVQTEELFCEGDRCPARRERYGLLYSDRSHVSLAVSKDLARSILAQLSGPPSTTLAAPALAR